MPAPSEQEIREWFTAKIPEGWFTEAPEVVVAKDEVLVVGRLSDDGATDRVSRANRIEGWRDETRAERMTIAHEAEVGFGRKVSWGARCGDEGRLFAHLNVPVMTRLRAKERAMLDTLIDAGVARSRADALAWCARLVESKQKEWLDDLRGAFAEVEKVRAEGPAA